MSDADRSPLASDIAEKLRALLEDSESISLHHDLASLFHDLAQRLYGIVTFDFLSLILHDAARDVMQLHICEGRNPGLEMPSLELALDESPSGIVFQTQQPLAMPSLDGEVRFPRLRELFREQGIESFCVVPLSTAQRKLGALGFANRTRYEYQPAEVNLMERIARQVAVAVDNALNYQRAQSYQQQLIRERDRVRMLLDVTNAVISKLDLRQLFSAISASLRRLLECEYVSLAIYDPETRRMNIRALDFPAGKGFLQEELSLPLDQTPAHDHRGSHGDQDESEDDPCDDRLQRENLAENVSERHACPSQMTDRTRPLLWPRHCHKQCTDILSEDVRTLSLGGGLPRSGSSSVWRTQRFRACGRAVIVASGQLIPQLAELAEFLLPAI